MPAQVFSPDAIDGVYIKEHTSPKPVFEPNAFRQFYSLPQLLDTIQARQLRAAIEKMNSDFPKQPLNIEGCVYFDAFAKSKSPDVTFSPAIFFGTHMPPSLRFSTDGNKNRLDSLFSMHLFPKIPLEKYAQPFYFKKTEVTNEEYREFVSYVRDSIARRLLTYNGFADEYLLSEQQLIKMGYHPDSLENINKEYWPLNMKEEVHWEAKDLDYKTALHEMYLPENQRFWRRNEIDARKLNYVYFTKEHNEIHKHVINVYPDTLCWVNDFGTNSTEHMTNMYYWHPAYNKCPVVGISYEQVQAFLHWKTKTEQQKLNAQGRNYLVEYALPTEIEWEIAATSEKKGDKIISYTDHFAALGDFSWTTDLMVDSAMSINEKVKVIVDTVVTLEGSGLIYLRPNRPSYLQHDDTLYQKDGTWYRRSITWYYWSAPRKSYLNDRMLSGYPTSTIDHMLFVSKADLEVVPQFEKRKYRDIEHNKVKLTYTVDNSVMLTQLDKNGISFMGGNVSEWIDADYSEWLPAFELRLKLLRAVGTPDAEMEYQREFYYNSFNDKNGKLVRGANWFDERYGNFLDKNTAGTNTKIFVSPKKARSTIGFRYVVRVKKKN